MVKWNLLKFLIGWHFQWKIYVKYLPFRTWFIEFVHQRHLIIFIFIRNIYIFAQWKCNMQSFTSFLVLSLYMWTLNIYSILLLTCISIHRMYLFQILFQNGFDKINKITISIVHLSMWNQSEKRIDSEIFAWFFHMELKIVNERTKPKKNWIFFCIIIFVCEIWNEERKIQNT